MKFVRKNAFFEAFLWLKYNRKALNAGRTTESHEKKFVGKNYFSLKIQVGFNFANSLSEGFSVPV